VKGRLVVAAVAGLTAAAVTVPGAVLGSAAVGGGPSLVLATLGPQSALVPPVPPPPVPPPVGEVVGVVEPGVIDAGMVEVVVVVHAAAAPAVPVNPETATSEVTAIPDPMINRLAHILVALLSVEA
jgi:hypothetical protein